jgi:hypothetical protein
MTLVGERRTDAEVASAIEREGVLFQVSANVHGDWITCDEAIPTHEEASKLVSKYKREDRENGNYYKYCISPM